MFFIKCFINSFPIIKMKSTITKKVKTSLNPLSLKLQIYDEIPTNLLKVRSVYISSPIQFVLSSEIFPQCLKYSVVKPLYKKW